MNLPISTNISQPSTAQAASASQAPDDAATQTADPFGSVLARQLAGDAATTGTSALKPSAEDALTAAADKKDSKKAASDSANTPPADMLAALLAAPAAQAAPAAAKPAEAAAPTTDIKGKAALLDGKAAPKLPTDAAGITTTAKSRHGVDSKAQNFAANLHAQHDKALHTPALEIQSKTQPLPDAAQSSAAALSSQFAQTNPLAATANVPAKLAVDTPVGGKDWGNNFSQKITWMATHKEQSAELHLNPPNLGPLDVVLKVSGDQATAMFTSPHAAVRDAVEQAMPRLREMMADNGIMLGNATVSDQGARDQQASQSQGQQQRALSGISDDITAIPAGASQGARTIQLSRHNGLVDTFA